MNATPTRPRRDHRAAFARPLAVGVLATFPILAAAVAGGTAVRARYCDQQDVARESVRILTEHTLQRPKRAQRLFVEGYFMRSLVAAHEVLRARDGDAAREGAFDSRSCLERAIAFADTMVLTQDRRGYWSLGYGAIWFADMGAAVGLFPALEPHVDDVRLARYTAATELFLRSMKRDRMLHEDGSVGMGRSLIIDPLRPPGRANPEPYLVATALVGIEARAWLYRRTKRPELREQAMRSLEYTLSQISDDGFREPAGRREGSIRIAAYVQEGWMAADAFLEDPAVLVRLRKALPAHVRWLLREQRADGTWDAPEDGTFTRTPAIVSFLMWYDERCKSSPEVRKAIRRASLTWVDRERWEAIGLWGDGADHEVLRALTGRPLAALALDRFVF